MLIPPRCYTCGEVLADKWIPYVSAIQTDKNKSEENISSEKELLELKFIDVTPSFSNTKALSIKLPISDSSKICFVKGLYKVNLNSLNETVWSFLISINFL